MGNAYNKPKRKLKSVIVEDKDTSFEKKSRPKKYKLNNEIKKEEEKINSKENKFLKRLSDNKLIKISY